MEKNKYEKEHKHVISLLNERNKLIDLKYPNLYWEQKGTHSFREGFVDFDDNEY
jgi:hypothetical protein